MRMSSFPARSTALASALGLVLASGTAAAAPQQSAFEDGDPIHRDDQRSRWRVGLNAGFTTPVEIDPAPGGPIDFENGYLLGGTLGYRVGALNERVDFHLELEGLYTEAKVDSDGLASFGSATAESTSAAAGLLNGVFDWHWSEKVTVRVGAGVGYSVIDFDTLEDIDNRFLLGSGQEDGVAAQGKLALDYDLGGGVSWSLGYRYFRTESLEAVDDTLGQSFDVTTEIHSIEFGVTYQL